MEEEKEVASREDEIKKIKNKERRKRIKMKR